MLSLDFSEVGNPDNESINSPSISIETSESSTSSFENKDEDATDEVVYLDQEQSKLVYNGYIYIHAKKMNLKPFVGDVLNVLGVL